MWDGGSTLTFITFQKAKQLKLKGKPVALKITVVGGDAKSIQSQLYKLTLSSPSGHNASIEAYGIETISTRIEAVDMKHIADVLNVKNIILRRPQVGEIDLLIGQQYAALHPTRVKSSGHLLLMENEFGYVIAGTYPMMKTDAEVSGSFLTVREAAVMHAVEECTSTDFFEIEGLGVTCQPKCGGCKCGTCHPGGKPMSLLEEKELEIIEKGLQFCPKIGRWIAKYPWIRSPNDLPDNRAAALGALRSAEKRLKKNKSLGETYNAQIEDMLERGVARVVPYEELHNYKGPKFYIHHFEVMNPKSKSTPCRIVFNSSACFQGHSLNGYLAKGPKMLNRLLGVLLRFRQGQHAFIGDISKMYHAIGIPLVDQMTHLFLWRGLKEDCPPITYAMTAVNMGDRPSATIAQLALRKTAEEVIQIYPEAANTIVRNAYMDDIPGSTVSASETMKITSEIDQILLKKGFRIKEWICSYKSDAHIRMGDNDEDIQEGVLGVTWSPRSDILIFSINEEEIDNNVTKRTMLSFTNKIFDPLGLLTPVTVRLKMLIREVWGHQPKIGWDEPVPVGISSDWKKLQSEFTRLADLYFDRSIRPDNAIEEPTLIIFSDGSEKAFGAAAYARWKLQNGKYASRLIAAKSRMAPIKTMDIVRLDLSGAVLGTRLRFTITNEMQVNWKRVLHLTDSEIVQAMIQKESYGFNTFVANRIGEINQSTDKSEWCWVPGKPWMNVADMTTRGVPISEIANNGIWQNGPVFLQTEEKDWPTKEASRSDIKLPELKQKFIVAAVEAAKETLLSRFNLNRYSQLRRLVWVTARLLRLYRRYKTPEVPTGSHPTVTDMKDAKTMWIKEAQTSLDLAKCKQLRPSLEDGIVVVGGRTERWMQATWNKQKFVLLPKDHQLSHLIVSHEHTAGGHLGTAATIDKIRSNYWIIGVTKMVKSLIGKCVPCRRARKKLYSQVMSPLPVERIKPSPPFAFVAVDMFGPFTIKGEVQKRTRGKCYGVLFTCMSCRAVYVDVAKDYSTDAFMQVIRRFASIRGWPTKVFSDPGSQLVGASKELKAAVADIEWEVVREYGIKNEVEWSFSPGDAPWYNGAVESLVKTVKKALNASIGENILSFSELLTCMFEAGQLVNQRPIGLHPGNPEDGTYLSPNDLLLGRASTNTPQGPFKERASDKHRHDFLQQIVSRFWKRWTREVFPNLVIQKKWHTAERNLCEGDVVLVQDANALRGVWKMAKVTRTIVSADNRVRRVFITYVSGNGTKQEVERAVQKLILLVPTVEAECTA